MPPSVRPLRFLAIAACLVGVLYAPFHAAAYLATPDGAESPPVLPWAGPFRSALPSAFGFASPDEVYLLYGKLGWVGFLGMLAAAVLLHAGQRGAAGRAERIGFFVLAAGLSLVALGAFVEYYTPYLEEAFMFLAGPGVLLTLAGYVTFGIGTREAGVAPRWLAWVFTLAPLIVIATIALLGHIPLAFAPLEIAWIAATLKTIRAET